MGEEQPTCTYLLSKNSWDFGNADKFFLETFISLLSQKCEESAHAQTAISQYHS